MKKVILFLPLFLTSCFQDTIPDTTTWEVLEVKSGDTILARDIDYPYEIKMACIKAGGKESHSFLSANIATASDRVIVKQIGNSLSPQTLLAPERILAEVFVDLGDGLQSLNEAQLLGGQARLIENVSFQNCPRIASMRKAQAEAQEMKEGMWQK
jgi:endonuclease YncB( thermonuclease family)